MKYIPITNGKRNINVNRTTINVYIKYKIGVIIP